MIGVEEKEGVEGKASRKEYYTLKNTPDIVFAEQKTLTREKNKRGKNRAH